MFARSIPFGLSDTHNKTKFRWSSLGLRGDLSRAQSPWNIAKTRSVSRGARRAQEAYVNVSQGCTGLSSPAKTRVLWHACFGQSRGEPWVVEQCSCSHAFQGTQGHQRRFCDRKPPGCPQSNCVFRTQVRSLLSPHVRPEGSVAVWSKAGFRCDLALWSEPGYSFAHDARSVQKREKRRIGNQHDAETVGVDTAAPKAALVCDQRFLCKAQTHVSRHNDKNSHSF